MRKDQLNAPGSDPAVLKDNFEPLSVVNCFAEPFIPVAVVNIKLLSAGVHVLLCRLNGAYQE